MIPHDTHKQLIIEQNKFITAVQQNQTEREKENLRNQQYIQQIARKTKLSTKEAIYKLHSKYIENSSQQNDSDQNRNNLICYITAIPSKQQLEEEKKKQAEIQQRILENEQRMKRKKRRIKRASERDVLHLASKEQSEQNWQQYVELLKFEQQVCSQLRQQSCSNQDVQQNYDIEANDFSQISQKIAANSSDIHISFSNGKQMTQDEKVGQYQKNEKININQLDISYVDKIEQKQPNQLLMGNYIQENRQKTQKDIAIQQKYVQQRYIDVNNNSQQSIDYSLQNIETVQENKQIIFNDQQNYDQNIDYYELTVLEEIQKQYNKILETIKQKPYLIKKQKNQKSDLISSIQSIGSNQQQLSTTQLNQQRSKSNNIKNYLQKQQQSTHIDKSLQQQYGIQVKSNNEIKQNQSQNNVKQKQYDEQMEYLFHKYCNSEGQSKIINRQKINLRLNLLKTNNE